MDNKKVRTKYGHCTFCQGRSLSNEITTLHASLVATIVVGKLTKKLNLNVELGDFCARCRTRVVSDKDSEYLHKRFSDDLKTRIMMLEIAIEEEFKEYTTPKSFLDD